MQRTLSTHLCVGAQNLKRPHVVLGHQYPLFSSVRILDPQQVDSQYSSYAHEFGVYGLFQDGIQLLCNLHQSGLLLGSVSQRAYRYRQRLVFDDFFGHDRLVHRLFLCHVEYDHVQVLCSDVLLFYQQVVEQVFHAPYHF